jgi:glycosyltransferase involved in cell wall biosynthesis
MKLSIVIPVYNEEKTIQSILDRVLAVLSDLEAVDEWEIILVDDCSTDGSGKILEEIQAADNRFLLLSQPVNRGKGAAIRAGISRSTGDILLIQDADMEYDPSDYGMLIRPIVDGKADVVYGSRFKGEVTRVLYFWHYMGNRFLTFLSNMFTNLNLTDMETCYKVFRGDLIRGMTLVSNRFGIEPELTAKIAKIPELRIYEVPVSYFGRTYAEGKKINWKDGCSAIWAIIKFNLLTGRSDSYETGGNSGSR